MKSIQIALLVALLLPAAAEVSADSRPSKSSSYKSGFSSQRSAPTSSNRGSSGAAPSRNGSFGSFGGRSSAPSRSAPPPAPAPSQADRGGGFGSFGNSAPRQDNAPVPRKSESALSQSMNKSNSEANALRTLEARRAAQEAANAPREIRPVPSGPLPSNGSYDNGNRNANNGQYGNGNNGQYGGGMPMPMPQPVQVQQSSGLMNVITGFLLARSISNSHPHGNNNGYPGSGSNNGSMNNGSNNGNNNGNNNGSVATGSMSNSDMATAAGANAIPVQSQPKSSWGMAILRTMAWLAILAVLGWLVYFVWKFLRRGKAPSTANYSFERN